jgi:hypothetical protein
MYPKASYTFSMFLEEHIIRILVAGLLLANLRISTMLLEE